MYTPAGSRIGALITSPDEQVTSKFVFSFIHDRHVELFMTKTRDWSGEHEYRFVVTAPDEHEQDVFADYGDSLAAVIVGERFPEWQHAGIERLCAARSVQLGKLAWANGRPKPMVLSSG